MNPPFQTIQWNHLVAAIRNECILALGTNITTHLAQALQKTQPYFQ